MSQDSEYEIDICGDEENGNNYDRPSTPKRKYQRQVYVEFGQCQTEEEWQRWLKKEDTWTRMNSCGETHYYVCKYSRRENSNCQSMLKCTNDKETISIFWNQKEHDHQSVSGLSANIKQCIKQKFVLGQRPAQISDSLLRQFGENGPTLMQVQNFVKREKGKAGLNKPMNVHELKQHCISNSAEPEDENLPFILGSYVSEDGSEFIVAWSTRKLLNFQLCSRLICFDGTYKLTSAGYPCLRAGFADANGKFFSTVLAISKTESAETYKKFFNFLKTRGYEPDVLMADAAKEISLAQKSVWNNCSRSTCFFNLIKNIKSKMKGGRLETFWPIIKSELDVLAKATTYSEFKKASILLNKSWQDRYSNDNDVKKILDSFFDVYVKDANNSGWWAGFAPECPRTNNSLESANKQPSFLMGIL